MIGGGGAGTSCVAAYLGNKMTSQVNAVLELVLLQHFEQTIHLCQEKTVLVHVVSNIFLRDWSV